MQFIMLVDIGEPNMQRRDLLKAFGAASAIALLPHETVAAWARVASGIRPRDGLTDAQLAHIGAIADTIVPRTDTPSATDVNVPAFVNVIVSENYTDAERAAFIDNLDAIPPDALDAIEAGNRRNEPGRTYWRLKGLIIHGYFTSQRVMQDVLKVEVMPGKFDGAAPWPTHHA